MDAGDEEEAKQSELHSRSPKHVYIFVLHHSGDTWWSVHFVWSPIHHYLRIMILIKLQSTTSWDLTSSYC